MSQLEYKNNCNGLVVDADDLHANMVIICAISPGKHKCVAPLKLQFSVTRLCVSMHDMTSASSCIWHHACLGPGQQLQSLTFCKALAARHVAHGLSQKLCLCVGTSLRWLLVHGNCTLKALAIVV